MTKSWEDYHNSQLYSECQLVSALNAAYHLTGNKVEQGSEKYEHLVDLCKARNGSALDIESAHHELNIITRKTYDKSQLYLVFESASVDFPIEINLWHHKVGFHSALIVGSEKRCRAIRVTNFGVETTTDGWIFWERFQYFIADYPNRDWSARLLGHKKRE
jgi:hypothetical protein